MKLKKSLRLILLVIIAISLYCCNYSNPNTDKVTPNKVAPDKKSLTWYQENWIQIRKNCNKLVLNRYYLNPDSNIIQDLTKVVWTDSTIDKKRIADFNQLFTDKKDSGYCCCPFSHYSISFYKDTSKLGVYFVDTSFQKGKAMFFDDFFQTSYFIDLEEWVSFVDNK